MAGRASWKGYLKLSLVSCPVKLYPATSSTAGKISFNLLHKDTLNRVQQKYTVVDVHIRGANLQHTIQRVTIDARGPSRQHQDKPTSPMSAEIAHAISTNGRFGGGSAHGQRQKN